MNSTLQLYRGPPDPNTRGLPGSSVVEHQQQGHDTHVIIAPQRRVTGQEHG